MHFTGMVLSSIVGVWALRTARHLRGRAGGGAARSALVRAVAADAEFGWARSEMGIEDLPGTCTPHDKHVFVLVADAPSAWPSKWEETAGLPKALTEALKVRKAELNGAKVKLTAATVLAAAGDAPSGDVLIYPDGIRVRNCSVEHVDRLFDLLADVRTRGAGLEVEPAHARSAAQSPAGEAAAVFVCAHTSRDKRCGIIGPALGEVFVGELVGSGRADVPVRMCSHIGGHKYAGSKRKDSASTSAHAAQPCGQEAPALTRMPLCAPSLHRGRRDRVRGRARALVRLCRPCCGSRDRGRAHRRWKAAHPCKALARAARLVRGGAKGEVQGMHSTMHARLVRVRHSPTATRTAMSDPVVPHSLPLAIMPDH